MKFSGSVIVFLICGLSCTSGTNSSRVEQTHSDVVAPDGVDQDAWADGGSEEHSADIENPDVSVDVEGEVLDVAQPRDEDAETSENDTGGQLVDVQTSQDGQLDDSFDADQTTKFDEKGCPLGITWPQRILMIGNSYTGANGGLNNMLKNMMKSHPCTPDISIEISKHSPGGKTIAQHFEQASKEDSNLNKLLGAKDGWDVVVLQDQSQVPGFPMSASPQKQQSVAVLGDFVKVVEATGARLVFFMTWGRRDGDKANDWIYPDYSAMQMELAKGYEFYAATAQKEAQQLVGLAPVGLGWQAVHDNTLAVAAVSSEEALTRFKSLYSGDGSHPSKRGTYLAAAVFFQYMTHARASLGDWLPDGIGGSEKKWLDSAAEFALGK